MRKLLALLLMLACPVWAATWYVDKDAAGANDGTSWADAWTSPWQIVWASVAAGDTVEISGGTYGTNGVASSISITASGTQAAPITIMSSDDVGHNDAVTIYSRFTTAAKWLVINGGKNPALTVTNTFDVYTLSNNINMTVVTLSNHVVNVIPSDTLAIKVKWLDLSEETPRAEKDGVELAPGVSATVTNVEVAYCHIHNVGDAIHFTQKLTNSNDSAMMAFHHNFISGVGDDPFEGTAPCRIYGNVINGYTDPRHGGHGDGAQIGLYRDSYFYNNIVHDQYNSWLRLGWDSVDPLWMSNVFVYGNLFYTATNAPLDTAISVTRGNISIGNPPVTNIYVTNLVFANNTLAMNPAGVFTFTTTGRTNTTLNNVLFANNVFFRTQGPRIRGAANGFVWSDTDVVADWNIVAGNTATERRWEYGNTIYANAEAMSAATIWTHNSNTVPTFRATNTYDFYPSVTDTMLIDQGTNLAALALPGLDTDLYGSTRGDDGTWDIGAFEYTTVLEPDTNTIALWLRFEDNFTNNGYAMDYSGNSRDMLRYGWGAVTTNFPSSTNGVVGSWAAQFLPFYTTHPYSDPSYFIGQYGSITNVPSLTFTTATFCAWVKFGPTSTADTTKDHNSTILDAGYGTLGNWHWGRYYSTTYGEPQFLIQTNTTGAILNTWRCKWPQLATHYWYTNALWWHLAASVDLSDENNLSVVLYTNGISCSTNTLFVATGVPQLTIHDATGAWGPWIAVGCWTHNGTPPLDDADEYPNNGWFNGTLDDIRIYPVVLTANQILNIAIVTNTPSASFPGNWNIQRLQIGNIIVTTPDTPE